MHMSITETPYTRETLEAAVRDSQRQYAKEIEGFHRAWYDAKHTWGMTRYCGVQTLKNPMDMWIYQEMIHDMQPDVIVETGTAYGGSALFFAHCLDRLKRGLVISIDVEPAMQLPNHPRIVYLRGSSVSREVWARVAEACEGQRVMVSLDSNHHADHVRAELDLYAPLVTPGGYVVVEDTNVNGHPATVGWTNGSGPYEAVEAFLEQYPEFVRDLLCERYLLTMMPGGWLRRTYA